MPTSPGAPDALVDEWLLWLRAGHMSPATVRLRRYMAAAFVEQYDPLTATPDQLAHFIASRPGGAWSKQGYLSTVRGLYRWLHATGRRHDDPTACLHSIRTPPAIPKPVPEAVLAAALEWADDRTRFAITLGAYAGLRRAEIAGLHSLDVQGDRLVITGKGRVVRRIPVHPRLRPFLDFDGWAFPSHRKPGTHFQPEAIGNWIAAALGEPYTAHSLRHRFATVAYANTHDIRAVQALLGHSSSETTSGYVGISDESMTAAVLSVA